MIVVVWPQQGTSCSNVIQRHPDLKKLRCMEPTTTLGCRSSQLYPLQAILEDKESCGSLDLVHGVILCWPLNYHFGLAVSAFSALQPGCSLRTRRRPGVFCGKLPEGPLRNLTPLLSAPKLRSISSRRFGAEEFSVDQQPALDPSKTLRVPTPGTDAQKGPKVEVPKPKSQEASESSYFS